MPGFVRGIGATGGFQGSIGNPTTSPDQLGGNSVDFPFGGGKGLGAAGDVAVGSEGSWTVTGTVGAADGGVGAATGVAVTNVLPACKE